MGRRKFFIFHCLFFIAVLFCGILQGNAAQPRATEILERLAAGFRAMDGYGVKFGVVSGDYEARGSYVVEGDSYYLVLGDAEVFADGAVRREVDNRRREVTVTGGRHREPQHPEQSGPGLRFSGQRIYAVARLRSRRPRRRAADARRRERLPGRRCHADGRHCDDASPLAFVRLRRRTGAGERAGGRAPCGARPAVR